MDVLFLQYQNDDVLVLAVGVFCCFRASCTINCHRGNFLRLDFAHLAERCRQFNNEEITPESVKERLLERLSTADIKQVKTDVLPFVRNPKELEIWSNDYFIQLAKMIIRLQPASAPLD